MDEPSNGPARFEDLLAGIASEIEAADAAALDADIAEVERAVRAESQILDRLRAQLHVTLEVTGGVHVSGLVAAVGRDVVVLASDDGDWAVPTWGIAAVLDLDGAHRTAVTASERLGLASIARAWAHQRSVVRVLRVGASAVDGTIDSVGADHLDLAEHDPGEPRRPEAVRRWLSIPLGAVAALRRR